IFPCGPGRLDLVQLDKGDLAWGFDSQSSELTCRCLRLTQEREEPTGGNGGLFVSDKVARALNRLLKASGLKWLQEVIQGIHLEGPKRVLIVSRGEDHDRQQ